MISNEDQNSTENDDPSSPINDSQDDSNFSEIEPEQSPSTSFFTQTEPPSEQTKLSFSGSRATKRFKQNDEVIEILNKRSDERNRLFKELSHTNERDPIDIFFESMASTVKQFTPELKIRAKTDIFHIVSKLELQNLQPKRQPYNSSTYIFPETVSPSSQGFQTLNSYSGSVDNTSTSNSFEIADSSAVNWTQPFIQQYENTEN